MMISPLLLTLCRIAIGLTFAASFLAKAQDVEQFAQTITNFRLLPAQWNRPLSLLFLSGELVVVIWLLVGGRFLPLGFGLASFLLFAFTLAITSALARNIRTSCNCFGNSRKPVSIADVWRNAGFLGLSLIGWWVYPLTQAGPGYQSWVESVRAGLAALVEGDVMITILAISTILLWLVLLFLILFVLLLVRRIRQLSQPSPKETILKEAIERRGQQAPPFKAQSISGETVTLDTFKGKAVAFIFLSPSCKSCVEKITDLNTYYPQAQAGGMEMVVVNVDHHIPSTTFAAQHAVQLPVLSAPQVSNPFANDYDANSTPSFCLVDAQQLIRASGHLDSRYWLDLLALMWQ